MKEYKIKCYEENKEGELVCVRIVKISEDVYEETYKSLIERYSLEVRDENDELIVDNL